MAKHSVLFVCLGNICRSPMAEAVFDELLRKRGVRDEWIIDSAGTGGHEAGSSIYSSAQRELKKHGNNYKHTARQITREDFEKFDYILAFDKDNIRNIEYMKQKLKPSHPKAEVKLLGFYNEKCKDKIIEDPWYNDTPQVFAECYTDCLDSCNGFLKSF